MLVLPLPYQFPCALPPATLMSLLIFFISLVAYFSLSCACDGYGRMDGRLFAVGVVDVLPGALSSVYTFYHPDFHFLRPGILSALKEIELVKDAMRTHPDCQFYYMGMCVCAGPCPWNVCCSFCRGIVYSSLVHVLDPPIRRRVLHS